MMGIEKDVDNRIISQSNHKHFVDSTDMKICMLFLGFVLIAIEGNQLLWLMNCYTLSTLTLFSQTKT